MMILKFILPVARIATFCLALLAGGLAVAAPVPPNPAVDQCLQNAANLHRVDLRLLRAVAKVESEFNPRARNSNKNGTGDTGLMQINDWWLPTLAQFGISKASLYDPCTSAYVGAWILAKEINKHGLTWRAVGAYNSPNEANQLIYAEKVNKALRGMP
ncbi:lytic transglycosylase domain-containing protein [Pseudomonas veronii]|uniref:lytic transglycosylase domain-containing protein n=1 Tax=Pseudomonas veronii TaxID=76761 RepID=UPI0015A36F7F|nr:lytic transglycosylase domain-containing protein [Pseudomonas veronii]NWD56717.1 lytic transglycosylase domain-containing protein [Pseudomonas veronii]